MGRALAATLLALVSLPAVGLAADAGPPPEPEAPALPADRIPKLDLAVEPTEVAVGELVTWRLVISRRVGDRVHLPAGASFGDLEVQSKDRTSGEERDGWVEEVLEVRLIPFTAGEHPIPAQQLTAVDIEGRVAELDTPEATVRVESLIANEPEPALKEDKGPGEVVLEEDYTPLIVLAILGGIGAVILLTLLGIKLWDMRKPRPGPPPPPPRPAEEIAYEKLEALRDSDLLDRGEHKQFHVLLSEAVREYVGNRYGFDSLERSTEELVFELRRLSLEPGRFDQLVGFLEETDLVKFAKLVPTLDESRGLLDGAFELVRSTTPERAPQPTGEPAAPRQEKGEGADA